VIVSYINIVSIHFLLLGTSKEFSHIQHSLHSNKERALADRLTKT